MSPPVLAKPLKRSPADWASLLALVVFWGSSFAILKIAVVSITPAWTVPLRLAAALVVFLPVFWYTGNRLPRDARFWLWMLWVSFVGTVMPFYLIAWGTQHIDSGVGGVLVGTVPLFVIALAHVFVPEERAGLPKLAGFVIGFLGLVVLIGPASLVRLGGGALEVMGQLAIVGAALGYALQSVSVRLMPPATVMQKTLSNIILALVLSLAAALPTGFEGVAGATPAGLAAVAALGLSATVLAGLVMFRLIATAGPSFLSLTNYLMPVYTLLLGAAAFGEVVEHRTLAGLVLILAGIAVVEIWQRRR